VTFKVGGTSSLYTIDKDPVCQCSRVFKNALERCFKESSTRQLTLPDVSNDIFETFAIWAYFHTLRLQHETSANPENFAAELLDLAIFGDRYDVPTMSNEVLRRWSQHGDQFQLATRGIRLRADANLPTNSRLRKLIAQVHNLAGVDPVVTVLVQYAWSRPLLRMIVEKIVKGTANEVQLRYYHDTVHRVLQGTSSSIDAHGLPIVHALFQVLKYRSG
jgi:hypothetical protein